MRPQIYTLSLTVANREYPFDIPSGLVKLTIKLRNPDNAWRLAYEQGQTKGTRYLSIEAGGVYWEDGIQYYPKGLRVYLNCPGAANQVAEILTWP